MDFHSLKRRDLQILCKKNNIPANSTNASMADALASLPSVEGIEEYLVQAEGNGEVSPERSVITSSNPPRTSTRQRVPKEELECSKLATRTRCSSRRRIVEGTGTKQTPATRTSQRTILQEASTRKIEEDMQAEFEANLEQSEVSESTKRLSDGCESKEVLEGSEVVDQGQVSLEKHDEEIQDLSTEIDAKLKVDFHSLSRKELQSLCKKNKIPANITNAAMIDALEALDSVEGLGDFLKDYDPLAAKSPEMSRMTSSRVCQTHTSQKTTRLRSAQAGSALSKMSVRKKDDCVVQILATKMESSVEDGERAASISMDEDVLSKEMENDQQSSHEAFPTNPESVSDCAAENYVCRRFDSKSPSEEVSDDINSSVTAESKKELLEDTEFNFDGEKDGHVDLEKECNLSRIDTIQEETSGNEADELVEVKVVLASHIIIPNIDDVLTTDDAVRQIESKSSEMATFQEDASGNEGDELVEVNVEEINNHADVESEKVILDVGEGESKSLREDEADISAVPEEFHGYSTENSFDEDKHDIETKNNFDEDKHDIEFDDLSVVLSERLSFDEQIVSEGLMQKSAGENESSNKSNNLLEDEGKLQSDVGKDDGLIAENFCETENVETHPKPNSDVATQDDGMAIHSASVFSNNTQELSCLQTNADKKSENRQEKGADFVTEHANKPKGTPLQHKSIRKLKKLLKEKLQAANLLASKMEKLTLEESEVVLDSNKADPEQTKEVPHKVKEGCEATEEASGELHIISESGFDAPIYTENVTAMTTVDTETLFQNYTESFNTGSSNLNLEKSDTVTGLPITPGKSSRKTPKPFVTPSRSSRKNHGLDVINKENIDNSASKTGPGKTEIAIIGSGKLFSSMSMGKLKKEFKVLQQQSEKKRPALQSRSENQCPLASP